MGSGCSVRSEQSSPDATSSRTRQWRSSWPTEVSANYICWNPLVFFFGAFPPSLSVFSLHSISHVQLPGPGHGKESGLQSPSCGSGHQLWTPTSQVGHMGQMKINLTRLYVSSVVPWCHFLWAVCWSIWAAWPAAESIWSPSAPVTEVDVQWPWLNWPNSLTGDSGAAGLQPGHWPQRKPQIPFRLALC